MTEKVRVFTVADLEAQQRSSGTRYLEFLRSSSMSAGLYALPERAADTQTPHSEDEIYLVLKGKARLRAAHEDRAVGAGSVIYIAAAIEHHFYDIEEPLALLVLFAPAET